MPAYCSVFEETPSRIEVEATAQPEVSTRLPKIIPQVKMNGSRQMPIVETVGKDHSAVLRSPARELWCLNRSDGGQPHLINIQFQKKVRLKVFLNTIQTYVFKLTTRTLLRRHQDYL